MKKNPAAVELGRLGGRAKSVAKTLAARANARKRWAGRRDPVLRPVGDPRET